LTIADFRYRIPFKKLNVETLSNAIAAALGPEIKEAANRFGEQIRSEVRVNDRYWLSDWPLLMFDR